MCGKSLKIGLVAILLMALAPAGGLVAAAPAPQADVILGHVTWQGRVDGTSPNAMPVKVYLMSMQGSKYELPPTVTDNDGYFIVNVDGVAKDTYKYVVKGPQYLSNAGEVVLVPGVAVTEVEMGVMRAGDVNADNVVGALDFSVMRVTFAKAEGDPNYDARADFTGDRIVNARDFVLLGSNFGFSGNQ
jgi:hypothetical protein